MKIYKKSQDLKTYKVEDPQKIKSTLYIERIKTYKKKIEKPQLVPLAKLKITL